MVWLYSEALANLFAILGSLASILFDCLSKLLAFFESPLYRAFTAVVTQVSGTVDSPCLFFLFFLFDFFSFLLAFLFFLLLSFFIAFLFFLFDLFFFLLAFLFFLDFLDFFLLLPGSASAALASLDEATSSERLFSSAFSAAERTARATRAPK